MWQWQSAMSDDAETNPTTQVLTLGGDLGVSFDLPIGWDNIDTFYFN